MNTKTSFRWLAGGLLAAALSTAQAVDFVPDALAVQAGGGGNGTDLAGAGVVWDWDFKRPAGPVELSADTELMLNHVRAQAFGGGNQSFTQVVLLPSLRLRPGQGRSPWFFELGIGASWMDRVFVTPHKTFSTQWNFYDMVGVGYALDDRRRHELGLRAVHISNAGIKQPNPGQNLLQLRYLGRF